jgi:hypothetical protein
MAQRRAAETEKDHGLRWRGGGPPFAEHGRMRKIRILALMVTLLGATGVSLMPGCNGVGDGWRPWGGNGQEEAAEMGADPGGDGDGGSMNGGGDGGSMNGGGDGGTTPEGSDMGIPDMTGIEPGDLGVLIYDAAVRYDGGIVISGGDGGVGRDGGGDGGTVPTRICYIATCQGKVYQCGDCMDNDGDGKIDSEDSNCLGPCDNSEDSFAPKIPGGNAAPCKADCFFDQGTGSGNDQCYWDHKCDPLEVAPKYDPEGVQCRYDPAAKPGPYTCTQAQMMQSTQCNNFCKPLTPNGCDCFGCCDIPDPTDRTKTHRVWLGSMDNAGNPTCSIDTVADPTKCRPCTKVNSCNKECGRCQLCIGKDTIPADCYMSGTPDGGMGGGGMDGGGMGGGDGGMGGGGMDGGGMDGGGGGVPGQCPMGVQACGLPGQAPCPNGWYCLTGCCIPPLQ